MGEDQFPCRGHLACALSRACSKSAIRSCASSHPTLNRMKPSGTLSPPQRAVVRPSCEHCRNWSPQRPIRNSVKTSRRTFSASVKLTTGPKISSDRRRWIGRVACQARVAQPRFSPGSKKLSNRVRILALAIQAQLERCQRTMRQPNFHRPGDCPICVRHVRNLSAHALSHGHMAENQIAVSCGRFRV
jgi:hypothetical protein